MRGIIEKTWGWDEYWQQRDFDRRISAYVASVIEYEGRAVGGLLLDSTPEFIDVVELQMLPECQGLGIGTSVLQPIIEEGSRRGLPVTLSVASADARAKQLYERLGFEVTGCEGSSSVCGIVGGRKLPDPQLDVGRSHSARLGMALAPRDAAASALSYWSTAVCMSRPPNA